jgi:hypothetical protein
MTMPFSEQSAPAELSPLQSSILGVLHACGGRLCMTALIFELRRRGLSVASVTSELRELSRRGLVRGPLSRTLVCELTIAGWDIGPQLTELTTKTPRDAAEKRARRSSTATLTPDA